MAYMISTSANYHWVKTISASTYGDGVLKLTFHGDRAANDAQFNDAEVTVFTDDVELTERLIEAINRVGAEHAAKAAQPALEEVA
jgi:hypothetical protein